MTKRFITFAAIAALLVAGCGEEQKLDFQPVAPKGEKAVSLRASVPQTKVLADNAGTFKWQNGDHITVITDGDHIRQFSTTDAGFEATFSGTIPTAENIGAYALYPASESHVAAGNMIEYHLDGDVVWCANASNMPMLGKVTGSGVKFKAIGGVLKLVLYNIPAEADYLQFVATNKQITGAFDIDDASASDVIIATGTGAGANKELLIDFSANYSENKVFYIPLPTGTIDGFTLNLLDAEYNELFSKTTTYNLVVAANHLILGPALNCAGATSDVSLTNAEIVAGVPSSYGSGTISSASGTWSFSKAMKQTTASITRMQIAAGEYLQLPAFSDEISSIVLHGTGNGGGQGFSGTFYVSSTSSNANQFASQAHSGALGDDVTISIPAGHTTGYILASGVFRIQSITVSFGGSSYDVPTIKTSTDNMTISVGTLTRSITVELDNPVDDLGISYILGKKDEKSTDWVSSVSIEGTNLTVTANGANGTAEDREATLTLRASGAQPKVINLKQTSALVQKPASINGIPGNGTVTASWTKDDHATGYVAYLCTSTGLADPTATGTELTPELDGTTYTVTKTGLTNGTDYYVYVKVDAVAPNYIADAEWAVSDAITPNNTIYYEKITSVGEIEAGAQYLIVCEGQGVVFNGGITDGSDYATASNTKIAVAIVDGKIVSTSEINAANVTILGTTDSYSILTSGGLYIGRSAYDNGLETSDTPFTHSIAFDEGNALLSISIAENSVALKYNSSWSGGGFRYYKNGQTAIQLYKLNDARASAGMSWSAASATATISDGDVITFTAPTLTPGNATGITYDSTDKDVATISNTGVVTILAGGTTTIKAVFDGDANYKPAVATYTLTVTDNRVTYDFENIAELNALITSTSTDFFGYLTDAVVSYVPDVNNAIIKDATGSILVFKSGHGLKQGQSFTGEVNVTTKLYYTTAEVTELDAVFAGSETVVAPETVTLTQLVGNFDAFQNAYVQATDLTVTGVSGKNISVSNGGKTYVVYDNAGTSSVSVGDIITATGTVADHNGTNQIKVWSSDKIVVTGTAPKTVSFSQPAAGGSFTVSVDGSPITSGTVVESGKTVTLVATPAANYNFTGWTVTGATVADDSAATTTFTMGDSSVTVSASFTSALAKKYVDVLTRSLTGISGTSYTAWSGKKGSKSSAVYAGQSAGGNDAIQLRSNNSNSGIVSTTSGGKLKKVVVSWNSNTSSGRTLNVYGKNSVYTNATDLYNNSEQGTLLGTIVFGTSTELTITGDYEYIGIRSASGALYLDEIDITWESVE